MLVSVTFCTSWCFLGIWRLSLVFPVVLGQTFREPKNPNLVNVIVNVKVIVNVYASVNQILEIHFLGLCFRFLRIEKGILWLFCGTGSGQWRVVWIYSFFQEHWVFVTLEKCTIGVDRAEVFSRWMCWYFSRAVSSCELEAKIGKKRKPGPCQAGCLPGQSWRSLLVVGWSGGFD